MSAGPGFAQQIIQAGHGLGFGTDRDPRRRIRSPEWTGSAGATPAMATPQPAGVGGEAVANPQPPRTRIIEDITDPSSSLYGQRHGGSIVTGIVDGITGSIDYVDKVRRGELDPRSEAGIEGAAQLASNVTLGAGAIPAEAGALRAGVGIYKGSDMSEAMQKLAAKYDETVPTRDVRNTTAGYRDRGELQARQTVTPESLKGKTLIGAPGDRTWAGHDLQSINGQDLAYDVPLLGGPDYMRTPHEGVWASAPGVIGKQAQGAEEALKAGSEPVLMYSAMGPKSGNFSTMTADALLAQVPGRNIDPAVKRAFDAKIREYHPDWNGMEDIQGARQQIMQPGAGGLRTTISNTFGTSEAQAAGLPDLGATRWATTNPDLRLAPEGSTGYAMAKISPNWTDSPSVPHPAYPHSIEGEYMGGFEGSGIPRELAFPDFYSGRRAAGKGTGGDRRSFEITAQGLRQKVDQEWIDRVRTWQESQKK